MKMSNVHLFRHDGASPHFDTKCRWQHLSIVSYNWNANTTTSKMKDMTDLKNLRITTIIDDHAKAGIGQKGKFTIIQNLEAHDLEA